MGDTITPELAGHLAFKIAEVTRAKFSEVIITEFSELAGKLAGVGEAADVLGVSKQRVHQLARKADFPSPIALLRATPVWLHDHLVTYGQNRKPVGRPRQSSE